MPKTPKQKESTDAYLMAGWSKRYGYEIRLEEVREINANLSAFVDVMDRMERYLKQKQHRKKRSVR